MYSGVLALFVAFEGITWSDVGLGPIFTDLIGKRDEHEEHEVETREIRGQTQG